jgi:hypothetical protein
MLQPGHPQCPSTSSDASPNSFHPFVVTQSRDIEFSCDSSHSTPNELLRARELLRYYTPHSLLQTPLTTAGTPSPSVVEPAEPLVDLGGKSVLSPVAVEDVPISGDKDVKSCDDLALRSFSQLLAVKLDCERSMVSLIDRTNQCVFLYPYPILMNIELDNTLIGILFLKQRAH